MANENAAAGDPFVNDMTDAVHGAPEVSTTESEEERSGERWLW